MRTPAGGKESRLLGGKGVNEGPDDIAERSGAEVAGAWREGGAVDVDGAAQYARHGKGSLSGLRMCIRRRVIDTTKNARRRSVRSYQGGHVLALKWKGRGREGTHDRYRPYRKERMSDDFLESPSRYPEGIAPVDSAPARRVGTEGPPAALFVSEPRFATGVAEHGRAQKRRARFAVGVGGGRGGHARKIMGRHGGVAARGNGGVHCGGGDGGDGGARIGSGGGGEQARVRRDVRTACELERGG